MSTEPLAGAHPSPRGGNAGIRDATSDDWPAVFPILSAVVDAGESLPYPLGLDADEARALWMEPPPGRTVVYELEGCIAGSAKMGPNRPGRGSHVATATFVVDERFRRQGIGRGLGEEVLRWAAEADYRAVQFNAVVETNQPALRLWRSLGFAIVGTVPEAFDHPRHGLVGLHVLHRFIGAGPPAT